MAVKKEEEGIHVRTGSAKLLYGGLGILVLVAALAQFTIIDLSTYLTALLTLVSALFVLSEINAYNMIKNRRLTHDPLTAFGAIVAFLAIIAVGFSLLGTEFALFIVVQGLINVLMFLFIIFQLFRK